MNAIRKTIPSKEGQRMLEMLQQAVSKTLEKKRRLGHYSVTWKDGRPLITGDDAPNADGRPAGLARKHQ